MKNKLLFILAFLVFTSSLSYSQGKTCLLETKDSPVLRGMRLGMTVDEIESVTGTKLKFEELVVGIALKKVKNGYVLISEDDPQYYEVKHHYIKGILYHFYTNNTANTPKLSGIGLLTLQFFKNSLSYISITYDTPDYTWKNAKEFLRDNEEKMNLPKGLWSNRPMEIPEVSEIICTGFTARLTVAPESVTIDVEDKRFNKLMQLEAKRLYIEDLEKTEREKLEKKKTFKP